MSARNNNSNNDNSNTKKRSGNKWTINEELQLQRNYELLKLSLPEIAAKHQRSVEAIAFKLVQEGFATRNSEAGLLVKRLLQEKEEAKVKQTSNLDALPSAQPRVTRSAAAPSSNATAEKTAQLRGRPAGVRASATHDRAPADIRRSALLNKIALAVQSRR